MPLKTHNHGRKVKQLIMIQEFSKFGLVHKKGIVCIGFNKSYYKTPKKPKKLNLMSKSGLFELCLLEQMVIAFSYIHYLPYKLNAEILIPKYYEKEEDKCTLNGIGRNVLCAFLAEYNENIKKFPEDIYSKENMEHLLLSELALLCYLDQIFKNNELRNRKMQLLSYLCFRKTSSEQKRCDWDRQFI